MNVDILRHELTQRIAGLGYEQMLQLRGYMDSFAEAYVLQSREEVPLQRQDMPARRMPGALKGTVWMSDDFDQTPDCFKDYL